MPGAVSNQSTVPNQSAVSNQPAVSGQPPASQRLEVAAWERSVMGAQALVPETQRVKRAQPVALSPASRRPAGAGALRQHCAARSPQYFVTARSVMARSVTAWMAEGAAAVRQPQERR